MPADLTSLTTFATPACADKVVYLTHREQLPTLAAEWWEAKTLVLGGGSNVLFIDDYDGTVIVNRLSGLQITADTAKIRVGGGVVWHDFVVKMSNQGYYGLENLALIPGSVGAAPVQNIGAYGVEAADFIDSVEVFDLTNGKGEVFSNSECEFAYRDSIFKRADNRGRYLITAVNFSLSKNFTPVLSYHGLDAQQPPQNAAQLLERVIAVRQSKLPDPQVLPNAGSFFKNPVITRRHWQELQGNYPDLPGFDIDAQRVKLPAAWLLEQCGFKGLRRPNGAGVYDQHALILVNHRQNGQAAHGREIYALACDMMAAVEQQFAVTLVPEVRIVGKQPARNQ